MWSMVGFHHIVDSVFSRCMNAPDKDLFSSAGTRRCWIHSYRVSAAFPRATAVHRQVGSMISCRSRVCGTFLSSHRLLLTDQASHDRLLCACRPALRIEHAVR